MINETKLSISAVIPAYNAETYIARAIDSVLAQTCPVDEIIVVDDGSTDKTAGIARSYGDKVKLIQQPNAGVSAARNTGIFAATGDWIAFLDADDEWLPNKIEWQVENLKRHPDLKWTTGNYIECLCDENRKAEHTTTQRCMAYLRGKDIFDSYFQAILLCQWGHTDCMLIQKKVFDEVGTFTTDLAIAEDIDVWLRIAYHYPTVGFVAEPLTIHHLSPENSLMKQARRAGLFAGFIGRHLALAQKKDRVGEFKSAGAFMMRRWIRGMLFDGQKTEIRELLNRFPEFFSPLYRCLMYAATVCPALTVSGLRLVSRMIRALKLRRRITRRPS